MKSLIIAFIILFGIAATAVYYPIQTDATLTGDGTVENPLAVASSFSTGKVAVTDTATMLSHFVERADTASMLGYYMLRSGRSGGQTLKGGTGTTDDLILQSTSGVGATGALIQFKGGNNGATTFGTFLNDGKFGIGTTSPTSLLSISEKLRLFDTTPTSADATTKMGYMVNNIRPAGLILESDGTDDILSLAINCSQVGTRNTSVSGGIFRMETRNGIGFQYGEQSFIIYGYPTGGSTATPRLMCSFQNGNTALNPNGGWTAIGTYVNASSSKLLVLSTTEQQRIAYDASNYYKTTVNSTGSPTFDAVGTSPKFTFSDPVTMGATVELKAYTVATLPTGVAGAVAYVTDALAPTYLAIIVGGGAIVTPVFYNGTNWVAH